ncbi:uncharacterized protein LOC124150775 [Haliotis rufescens]|uniref:uncharacterized protein LOC124150775 n=1 Tax=Haliotis rufescens TaxID=6454 RepID=UPI001EB005C9|nr:uncharacterized protein LOC124150775 [Haliotis rufescens]
MRVVYRTARPTPVNHGMVKPIRICVILACVCVIASAFPVGDNPVKRYQEYSRRWSTVKRGRDMVDAWALCPPDMEQMDCFYTYLRLYARLRKAARETDQVSMRNIGKRGSSDFLCADMEDRRKCFSTILQSNLNIKRSGTSWP